MAKSYPFTPVAAIPSTKYFCAAKNTSAKGRTDNTDPVIIYAYSESCSLFCENKFFEVVLAMQVLEATL